MRCPLLLPTVRILGALPILLVLGSCGKSRCGESTDASRTPGLLAEDGFEGLSSGFGWAMRYVRPAGDKKDDSRWLIDAPNAPSPRDDRDLTPFSYENATPLVFSDLKTSPGYMHHGDRFRNVAKAARNLDVAGALADYRNGEFIGAPGKTLWISMLVCLEEDRDEPWSVILCRDPAHAFEPGYKGAGDPGSLLTVGVHKKRTKRLCWTLFDGNPYEGEMAKSERDATLGKASLLVMRVEFLEDRTSISLFVNPTKLGGQEPATADATLMTSKPLTFRSILWCGIGQTSSIDELRVGTSFAAATPVSEGPKAPARPAKVTQVVPFQEFWKEEGFIEAGQDPSVFAPVEAKDRAALRARLTNAGAKDKGQTFYRCSVYYAGMAVHRLLLEGDRLIVEVDPYKHPHGSRLAPPQGKYYQFHHYIAVERELAYSHYEIRYIGMQVKP